MGSSNCTTQQELRSSCSSPSTISVINNLAATLGELGQLDEAAKMKEVLEKRRRILGGEHPSTISAMNNLANTLGELDQLDEAIALLEVAVHKMKQIHGEYHPHTKSLSVTSLDLLFPELNIE